MITDSLTRHVIKSTVWTCKNTRIQNFFKDMTYKNILNAVVRLRHCDLSMFGLKHGDNLSAWGVRLHTSDPS